MAKKEISKNARVAMRGKNENKFYKGKKVKPIKIRSMTGGGIIGVLDEASGSLLMSDNNSSNNKNSFLSWDSISSEITSE